MPELQKLHAALAGRADVAFVLLQAREKFEVSRQWAARQGIALPLHDSGSTGEDDDGFRLAGGRTVRDREIAGRFPTTYVLDKRGLIVFAHVGPVHDWRQYEPFLRVNYRTCACSFLRTQGVKDSKWIRNISFGRDEYDSLVSPLVNINRALLFYSAAGKL